MTVKSTWNVKILNLRSTLEILEESNFKFEFAADLKIVGINVENLNFDTGFMGKTRSLRQLVPVPCKVLSTFQSARK